MNNSKIHSDKVESCKKLDRSVKDYSSTDDMALHYKVKLPPPSENFSDCRIPPPPCGLQQPPLRSCSSRRRSFRKSDDPFLIAYKECTKSSKKDNWESKFNRKSRDDGDHVGLIGLKKSMSIFSCKLSCNVTDDNIVKVSKLPSSRTIIRESHGD